MHLQNNNKVEITPLEQVKSLIAELDIKGWQKKGYLNTAKNNPELVLEQLEAFKQYKADFNNDILDLYIIDSNGI